MKKLASYLSIVFFCLTSAGIAHSHTKENVEKIIKILKSEIAERVKLGFDKDEGTANLRKQLKDNEQILRDIKNGKH
jgi:hypothetical protein